MAVGGASGPQGSGGANGTTPVEVDRDLNLPVSVDPAQGGETADSYVSGGVPDVAGSLVTQPGNPILTRQTGAEGGVADLSSALQSAREGNSDAIAVLVKELSMRPKLAGQIIFTLIEVATANGIAARALTNLATEIPKLFDTGHIPGMIEVTKRYGETAWALAYLAKARPDLAPVIIHGMIEAAKVYGEATWALANLAEARPDLAPVIIPGLIEAAKVNEQAAWALADIAKEKPGLAPVIIHGLIAALKQPATVQVGAAPSLGVRVGEAQGTDEVAVGPSVVPSSEVAVGFSPEQQVGHLTAGAAAMAAVPFEIIVPEAGLAADAAARAAEAILTVTLIRPK